MTPRERWLAVLRRERPDRVPTDYQATPEVTRRLLADLKCRNETELWRRLHIDRRYGVGPRLKEAFRPTDGTDIWGLRYRKIAYGNGAGEYDEVANHPLAEAKSVGDLETFRWPSADWFDYSDIGAQCEAAAGHPITAGSYEPFLKHCQLRGLEQGFMDLLTEPGIAHFVLGRLFDFHRELNLRTWEEAGGKADLTYVAEDMGSQQSLLFSPQAYREFLKPNQKAMIEVAHQHGITVIHHDDGAIRPLLPELIEIGIDVLNPVQWRCAGMGREGLKRDFGDRLVFHGAMDNQRTLAFGSVADVRREVVENLRILGAGGGYILAPCHNIQTLTSTEKIVAMYETAHAEGKY